MANKAFRQSLISKALMKLTSIAPEKLSLTRHELHSTVALTSKFITQLEMILTSKTESLFSAFGISITQGLILGANKE